MKFLGLIVILAYISLCSAAANRSTIWLVADELIYTINGYQKCSQAASTVNKTLVTTQYYTVTTGASADTQYLSAFTGAGTTGTTYVLKTMQLSFVYGDNVTPNLVFTLPAFGSMSAVIAGSFQSLITNIIAPGTYLNAYGVPWVHARVVYANGFTSSGVAQGTLTNAVPTSASVLITDYRSKSSFLVTQFQDGENIGANFYNHLYSVIIRTPTSLLTSTSDILVGGCTVAARTGLAQVTTGSSLGTTACTTQVATATTYDSSFSGVTCTTSDTGLPDALNLAVAGVSTFRTQDNALFGAAGSKFSIAASFGFFIAMSSIFINF